MDKTIYTREYSALLRLLAERREKSALTQTQLAKKLGVAQSTISKFERGDRRLDVIQLRTIRYLGRAFDGPRMVSIPVVGASPVCTVFARSFTGCVAGHRQVNNIRFSLIFSMKKPT